MRTELKRRLERLEHVAEDDDVAAISRIMDELSAEAVGNTAKASRHPTLREILEGENDAP